MTREFVEDKIKELNNEIEHKEKFLRYAKEQDVREGLNKEIALLSYKRDILFNMLK